MPRPAWIVRGRRLTGMTEEIAPAATRPAPLGRANYHLTDHGGRPGSGHRPSPRPADQPTANKAKKAKKPMDTLDAHCRKPGCDCQHIICHRGWKNDTEHHTTPCEYCRPFTHARWLKREAARQKGYPIEALGRIMRGENGK